MTGASAAEATKGAGFGAGPFLKFCGTGFFGCASVGGFFALAAGLPGGAVVAFDDAAGDAEGEGAGEGVVACAGAASPVRTTAEIAKPDKRDRKAAMLRPRMFMLPSERPLRPQ
ncbi:hypothetical protein [Arthrobacter bambusae]|uniref:hypothetical protein n=1 Tax=Arthrobacter bambusae TaxID=1338426 RepID=UPI00278A10A0|nr:hypothetical protein [Arthrobacter bambusae]MDQ0028487.1 hypothetical protein [Arthrobacter bambusae]MDQ0096718.1 hypothetical protein [Arthrobacter bambusae]